MRIDEKIEKYLLSEKPSQEEAMAKVIKTVKSAKDDKQMGTAVNMFKSFVKMYGEGTGLGDFGGDFGDLPRNGKYNKKIYDAIQKRMHELSV